MTDWVDRQLRQRGIRDERVLEAFKKVRRHEFVPEKLRAEAYEDYPLPIGFGQTISQPYIVALMTELLKLDADGRVLEIGTGSGYQTAILAELAREVYTVEVVAELYRAAKQRLTALGYDNLHFRHGDGHEGWPEHAPYHGIIVTAAPDHIPPALKAQMADGGRLVIPVGRPGEVQILWLVTRVGDKFEARRITEVAFVPLTGRRDDT